MNDRQRTVSTMTYSHVEGKGFAHAKAIYQNPSHHIDYYQQ
ncbi:MAG: hypothetical protein ACOC44_17850 [Promethearchaeia archaeon]